MHVRVAASLALHRAVPIRSFMDMVEVMLIRLCTADGAFPPGNFIMTLCAFHVLFAIMMIFLRPFTLMMLYTSNAAGQNRTDDASLFRAALYH